jgi:hypothetical protein
MGVEGDCINHEIGSGWQLTRLVMAFIVFNRSDEVCLHISIFLPLHNISTLFGNLRYWLTLDKQIFPIPFHPRNLVSSFLRR